MTIHSNMFVSLHYHLPGCTGGENTQSIGLMFKLFPLDPGKCKCMKNICDPYNNWGDLHLQSDEMKKVNKQCL